MLGRKRTFAQKGGRAHAAALLWLLASFGCGSTTESADDAGIDLEAIREAAAASDHVYDGSVVRHYEVELAEADWDELQRFPVREMYAPAVLRFEGETYETVGLRFKGFRGSLYNCFHCCSATDTRAECPEQQCYDEDGVIAENSCSRLNLKISFRKFGDVEFHGLRKLNFHAMNSDPSHMRERVAYSIFQDFDVPAPRTAHATLTVNGEFLGLFTLVEQVDRAFAQRRFDDGGRGNIYKERWPLASEDPAYFDSGRRSVGSGPEGVEAMVEFASALRDAEPDGYAAVLRQYTDYDLLMRHIAVDRMINHFDGITSFRCRYLEDIAVLPQDIAEAQRPPLGWETCQNKNYFWYESADTGLQTLVPWDMDYTLYTRRSDWRTDPLPGQCDVAPSNRPPTCDPLIRAFAHEMYGDVEAAGRILVDEVFDMEKVRARVDLWKEALREAERVQGTEWAANDILIALLLRDLETVAGEFASTL